jgi:gliding motility-associated-like protein
LPKPPETVLSFASCDTTETFSPVPGEVFSISRRSDRLVLSGQAAGGCDSIINVNVTYNQLSFTSNTKYLCDEPLPTFSINFANQPGPYKVYLNQQLVSSNQALPYTTQLPAGDNEIILETPQGCADTLKVEVDALGFGPVVELVQVPLLDGFTQINVLAPNNSIYDLKWTPAATLSCNDCFNPVASQAPTTQYILSYKYGDDCLDTSSITILAVPNREINVPNVLVVGSANNGTFYIKLPQDVNALVKRMSIYDRWGNLMFNIKDVAAGEPSFGWDGLYNSQPVNPGVYIYLVELLVEGKSKVEVFKGDLTVLR